MVDTSLFVELNDEEKVGTVSMDTDEDYIIYGLGLSKFEYRHLRFCDVDIVQGVICALIRTGRGTERIAVVPMGIYTQFLDALDNIFVERNLRKGKDLQKKVLSRLKSYTYDYNNVSKYYNRDIEEEFAFVYQYQDGSIVKTNA